LRLVYDTNIIISALLFEGSKPAKAFDIGINQGAILFSSSTVTELEEVLLRNKFDQYISHEECKQFLTSFILDSTPVEINETISECRDPQDNKFLELAVCGKAAFIISGDEDLLVLNPFRNIQKRFRGRSCRDCIIFQRYFSTGGGFPVEAKRITHELVTPRYRATSAPEYPNSLIANQDNTCRASTTCCLLLPDRSSP